jgi:histidyl-tRNA synthetase
MCDLCKDRLNKNPLRILDCKNEECIKVNADATVIQDYLCDDCKAHQAGLMSALDILGITYKINPRIVRGLDYYTRTVFEFISKNIGAQGTVCGGGRYNNLVEEVGGKPCPAVGFGMGLERLIMVMEALGLPFGSEPRTEVYIAPMSDSERSIAINIASKLRGEGISVEFDIMGRGLKSQLKYANKVSAKYLLVIGEQERLSGEFKLKDMDLGAEETITVNAIGAYVKARRL